MNDMMMRHRSRKSEQLAICRERFVESDSVTTGFEAYRFVHEALPEISLDDVDTGTILFGRPIAVPFVISSMTGGCEEGGEVNRVLAEAAQAVGVAMGVGSERAAILDPRLADTYRVRRFAPDIPLFANIGAVQLNAGFCLDDCRAAVDLIEADALILHLNPLQESVQHGGDTNFSGLAAKIEEVCRMVGVPVLAKEVGGGISERTARLLREAGVSAIDTAGAGGTSWPRVESLCGGGLEDVGNTFANWGIPTAESIIECRRAAPDLVIIGSGGLRSGLDAAKAIALGADIAGFGLPLLKEATGGVESVVERLKRYREELRITMFCTAARNTTELKSTEALRPV